MPPTRFFSPPPPFKTRGGSSNKLIEAFLGKLLATVGFVLEMGAGSILWMPLV